MKSIFALATPLGKSGIAVIRISGEKAAAALAQLGVSPLPSPRMATRAKLTHPETGAVIDDALVLWFPAPHSFTGEDVAELHIHGSRAVIDMLYAVLGRLEGMRLAEAGEFSKRAFLNGKMDLTETEGIADLIAAETEAQQRQALRLVSGELAVFYDTLRARILKILAFTEAYIDFPDEDIPQHITEEIRAEVDSLTRDIGLYLNDKRRGEKIRDGLYIAILGAPNVGKSTLLNRLARREAAIVSATAGTTRDVIEVRLDIAGYAVTVADTAGLREAGDEIEAEGIKRARQKAEEADIKILLLDATSMESIPREILDMVGNATILVVNKIDLAPSPPLPPVGTAPIFISLKEEKNLGELMDILEGVIKETLATGNAPVITRARHRIALENAMLHLKNYVGCAAIELQCEELRQAALAIGSITGVIAVDDLLGEIFSNFCIGK